ncbi:ribonuclease H-like domain-containing protein [Aspergillus granulosus]|uniref:Ribonuclease H-like domain-containing protein n=1 Tax=Aspergillus granulosus TaxID=176169 RepID=A0ABR4GVG9_9EURO
MSKGQQATGSTVGDGGGFFCRICQRPFIDANALQMHCRTSRVHQQKEKDLAASPPTSNASVSKSTPLIKSYTCNPCGRIFKTRSALRNHRKDSPKHRPFPSSQQNKPATSTATTTQAVPEPGSKSVTTAIGNHVNLQERYDHIPSSRLQDAATGPQAVQLHPLPTIGDILSTPNSLEYDVTRHFWVERVPDATKNGVNISFVSVPVEHADNDTGSETHELVPKVPEPWSIISLRDRDVVFKALEAQCHSVECLSKELYWIQKPSPADVDMSRKCTNCGAAKRKINTNTAGMVCQFHPARKPFERGILRGRGTGASERARCVNCPQIGNSNGCIVLSAHDFAAPDAKLSEMAPTPVYNPTARKAVVLDCEMVGVLGANSCEISEVVRLSAVDFLTGEVLVDTYVSPQRPVISWRTKYSGVNALLLREKMLEGNVIKGWKAARDRLWQFINAQTILIGHSLNNDLAVLGMVHTRVVDSAILTRAAVGEDCNRHWGLSILAQQFLGQEIQTGSNGHDCVEDTFATREVALWCLQNPSKLQAWAADERRIIAEKQRKKAAAAAEESEVSLVT